MRRRLARPGLTYFEANSGRLVTETAELLDAKAMIRERWPNLDVYFDHYERMFVVVQKVWDPETQCHIERAFMTRPYCGDKLFEEIEKANPESPYFVDPEDAIDKHNAGVERDRDREVEDIAGDFGERLIHALKKDGFMDHENIFGAPARPQLAQRALRDSRRT